MTDSYVGLKMTVGSPNFGAPRAIAMEIPLISRVARFPVNMATGVLYVTNTTGRSQSLLIATTVGHLIHQMMR